MIYSFAIEDPIEVLGLLSDVFSLLVLTYLLQGFFTKYHADTDRPIAIAL
jgi:hypothetical protein